MNPKKRTTIDGLHLVLEDGTELPAEALTEVKVETEAEAEVPIFNPPDEYHGTFDYKIPKCFINGEKFMENLHFNLLRKWINE